MNKFELINPSGDDPDGAPSSLNASLSNPGETSDEDSLLRSRRCAFLDKQLVDHKDLSTVQRAVYAKTLKHLMSRVLFVDELFKEGALAKDAAHLGISPEWAETLRADGPKVVIYEQPQPLPSLYAAIEDYGSPDQACRSLQRVKLLRDQLEIALGQPVETGLTSFPYLGVSFRGISYGGYFSFPHPNETGIKRVNFFSHRERSYYEHASYRDLWFSQRKIAEFEKLLNSSSSSARAKISSTKNSMQKRTSVASGFESQISSALVAHGAQVEPPSQFLDRRISASECMKNDITAALQDCSHLATPQGDLPFIEFVGAFNKRFAARFAPELDFQNIAMQPIENFASVGVQDWSRFVRALLSSGIITDGEAIARYRTVKDGRVRYANVYPDQIRDDTLIVSLKSDWGLDDSCNIKDLETESAINLRKEGVPTLSPISKVRYLLNMAFGSSIILCDGMEFGLISEVTKAMQGSSLLLYPRLPQIHAYSTLCGYKPQDPGQPWANLRETHRALDYYQYAIESQELA